MGERTVRAKSDWIQVIEAAYAPARDDEEWARRLTSLGKAVFGRADLFGMTVLKHDADCASMDMLLSLGVPTASRDHLDAFAALGPSYLRELFYPPTLVTTHQLISAGMPAAAREYLAEFRKNWGVADGLGLCVHPEPGIALVYYAGFDETITLTRRERRMLSQIALHVETSYRLRHRGDAVKAVISADGKVLHREKDAPETSALGAHVARIEQARTRAMRKSADAIDLWKALVAGRASLVERTEGSRRHYLVVENAPATQPVRSLTRGELDVVSYATHGLSAKLVAYGLGLSEPTVSQRLESAATKVGVATRMELVRIAAMLTRDPRARFEDIALTTAERDVLTLLEQGLSNREIAAIRNRSVHTIAKQVAELLRKTKAPTRRALVARAPKNG